MLQYEGCAGVLYMQKYVLALKAYCDSIKGLARVTKFDFTHIDQYKCRYIIEVSGTEKGLDRVRGFMEGYKVGVSG